MGVVRRVLSTLALGCTSGAACTGLLGISGDYTLYDAGSGPGGEGAAAQDSGSCTVVDMEPDGSSYDPRDYVPRQGSPAGGAANGMYLPPADFFNTPRSTHDIGATIVGARCSPTPLPGTVTDPFGNTVGAGLTVQQSGAGKTISCTPKDSTTFQTCVNNASPGDTVLLVGGNYMWTGTPLLTASGTKTDWIIVKPTAEASVTITGPGIGVLSDAGTSALTLSTAQYISVEGITFNGFGAGIVIIGGSYMRLRGNTVSTIGGAGIAAYKIQNLPSNYEISGNTVSYTNQLWANTAAQGGWGASIVATGQNVTVSGNTVSYGEGEGIEPIGEDIWVVNNVVYDHAQPAIYNDGSSEVVIENNFVYQDQANGTFWSTTPTKDTRDGIRIADDGYVLGATGLDFPVLTDITVRDNIVWGASVLFSYDNYGQAHPMSHVRIENNTLVGGQMGTITPFRLDAPAMGTDTDVVIANNIAAWTSGSAANNIATTAHRTFTNQLWFNVTVGTGAGAGDVMGNPELGQ
jgi:hypothetical protein